MLLPRPHLTSCSWQRPCHSWWRLSSLQWNQQPFSLQNVNSVNIQAILQALFSPVTKAWRGRCILTLDWKKRKINYSLLPVCGIHQEEDKLDSSISHRQGDRTCVHNYTGLLELPSEHDQLIWGESTFRELWEIRKVIVFLTWPQMAGTFTRAGHKLII